MSKEFDLKALILVLSAGFITGAGWFLMKGQVATVTPELSVIYRLCLAAPVAIIYGFLVNKDQIPKSLRLHLMFASIGFFLYAVFYWFSYRSIQYIPSGILSVIISMMMITNFLFSYFFLKENIHQQVVISSLLCLISFLILFFKDFLDIGSPQDAVWGFLFGFLSICAYSGGTVLIQKFSLTYSEFKKVSAASLSGYSMLYGAFFSLVKILFMQDVVYFENTSWYIGCLLYLGLFLTPVVMITYVYLSKTYSASIAALVWVIAPIVAIFISAFMGEIVLDIQNSAGIFIGILGVFLLCCKRKN